MMNNNVYHQQPYHLMHMHPSQSNAFAQYGIMNPTGNATTNNTNNVLSSIASSSASSPTSIQLPTSNNNNNNINNPNNSNNNNAVNGFMTSTNAAVALDASSFKHKLGLSQTQTIPTPQQQGYINHSPFQLQSIPNLIQNGHHLLSVLSPLQANSLPMATTNTNNANNTNSINSTTTTNHSLNINPAALSSVPIRTIAPTSLYNVTGDGMMVLGKTNGTESMLRTQSTTPTSNNNISHPTSSSTTAALIAKSNLSSPFDTVNSPNFQNQTILSGGMTRSSFDGINQPSENSETHRKMPSGSSQHSLQLPVGGPVKQSRNQIKDKKQSVLSHTSTNSSASASSSDDYESRKRERKLAVNREAARASRARKRQRIFELEVGAHILRKENRNLSSKLQQVCEVLKHIGKASESNKQICELVDNEVKNISSVLESLTPRLEIPKTSAAAAKYCEEFNVNGSNIDQNLAIEPSATRNKSGEEDNDDNTESGSNYSVTSEVR